MTHVSTDLQTLAQELTEITRLVEDDDLDSTLRRYVDRVVHTVDGCDHASITVDTKTGPETVTGGAEPLLSYLTGNSPGDVSPIVEVLRYREPRRLPDVDSDQRWPEFGARMAKAGYHSALCLPLDTKAEPAAAFTLFSRKPNEFADTSYDMVLLFALHAGVAFDNVSLYSDCQTLVKHLRDALGTRSVIGQAQGLLMHCHGYGTEAAFGALRTASQHHNTKLREVARILVEAQQSDQLDAALRRFGLEQGT
jgi:transcriptional regulator with GAF, ATPase, and Fis domain